MGLLFVREGDEQAEGPSFDLGIGDHGAILEQARSSEHGPFPLVRRLNNYWGDALFEHDELSALIAELQRIRGFASCEAVAHLVAFCVAAREAGDGVETICD